MRLTITLLLASVPFLAIGGEGLYRAAANRQLVALTCEQLAAGPARGSWMTISGCQLGDDVRYREADGRISELLFPVRRSGQPHSEPALMIAATRHPEVLAIAQEVIGAGRSAGDDARTVMMLRVLTALGAAREINGVTRRGLLDALETRRTLAAVDLPLVHGGLVFDLNERPRVLLPAVLTGAGGALLLTALALTLVRPKTTGAAPAVPRPADPAAQPAVDGVRISGLMLLNLGPAAGRDAIDQAPPLGPRDTVELAIAGAIAGMTFDGRGNGRLTSDDSSIEIDLGPGAVAWTAVLRARGRGVHQVVRTLVTTTGWRIYYPKRGAFLDVDDLDLL